MKAFLRQLRPDHLAGQIALLILAAIVMFHLTMTTIQHFTDPDGRPPIIEPSEFIASALLAIDAAPVSERSDVLAALARAAPWANFAVRDQPGDIPAVSAASADLDELRSRLWAGARVVAASKATDKRGGAVVVALRNGGFAVATTLEKHIAPLLIGRDPEAIEDTWQYLYRGPYWRGGPVQMTALAGVDLALWDIKGKRAGMPVYQLLGGRTRHGALAYTHAAGNDVT